MPEETRLFCDKCGRVTVHRINESRQSAFMSCLVCIEKLEKQMTIPGIGESNEQA